MSKYLLSVLFLLLMINMSMSQERKTIKPKPAKGEKESIIKEKPDTTAKDSVIRSKIQRKPFTNIGMASFNAFRNKYMGFGAHYQKLLAERRFAWSVHFHYFTIPSDQFYFDWYRYQYVQRNRGSMLILTISGQYKLPIFQDEPNINPHWKAGVGPVLGIQTSLHHSFPGSITHAFSIGGLTAYTGPGLSYFLGSWVLRFDIHYQFLRFPQKIFGKENFDGLMFTVGVGKMF